MWAPSPVQCPDAVIYSAASQLSRSVARTLRQSKCWLSRNRLGSLLEDGRIARVYARDTLQSRSLRALCVLNIVWARCLHCFNLFRHALCGRRCLPEKQGSSFGVGGVGLSSRSAEGGLTRVLANGREVVHHAEEGVWFSLSAWRPYIAWCEHAYRTFIHTAQVVRSSRAVPPHV